MGQQVRNVATLGIEFVAEMARLQNDLDKMKRAVGDASGDIARNARAANDNLANIGKGAGAGIQAFSRDVAALKARMDPAWASMEQYKKEVRLLQDALAQGAITHKQFVSELRNSVNTLRNVETGSVKASGAGKQFAMQMSQVGQQVMAGTGAVQALAMQLPDIAVGMSNAGAGASRFASILGGPWGIGITTAISLLVSLGAAHFGASKAEEEHEKKVKDLIKSLHDMHDATVSAMQSTYEKIAASIRAAEAARAEAQETRRLTVAQLELAKGRATAAKASIVPGAPGYSNAFNLGEQGKQEAETRRIQAEIDKQNAAIDAGNQGIRLKFGELAKLQVAAEFDKNAAATLKYDKSLDGLWKRLETGKITMDQYKDGLRASQRVLDAEQEAIRKSNEKHRDRAVKLTDEQKAYKQATEASEAYIKTLGEEIGRIGKTPEQIRLAEVAKAKEAATTAALAAEIQKLGDAREAAYAAQAAEDQRKQNADLAETIAQMKRELQLVGLVGAARERATAAMVLDNEVRKIGLQVTAAETAGNTALVEQLQKKITLLYQQYGIEMKRIDMSDQLNKDAEAAKALNEQLQVQNEQLREMISILGNLGGMGSVLGTLLGIATGNTSSIGGKFGDLLNIGIGGTTTDRDGRLVAKTIGTEMAEIFKVNGEFGKTMTSILQGAGTGVTAASALFGKQSGTEQVGSAIGGVLGQEAGKALGNAIGGLAGKIGGPLGAIAGGVLGSVLGGMLTKVKWGRVDLSSEGVSGTVGNSSNSERAALTAGNSIFGALGDIASAFGGSVGDFGKISVGVRHGDYRVNAGGTSLKVKNGAVDFNDDAEAAIAYAIQLAIDRGAIQGVRASTSKLLKAGDDLQASIEKALKFEGVFSELKSITDPMAFAIETVGKEFDQLRDIFKEAGATAEEYAQLEQLLAIKRQEAIDSAMQDQVDKYADQNALEVRILELLGQNEEALRMTRLAELAATTAALQPMQALVYQLEDLTDTVDKFGPLADDLRAFKKELLGGDTLTSFAGLQATFRSTSASAALGDATALGNLRGVSQDYTDAALANAGSAIEYQRAMSEVLNAVDQGIFAADTQVDYAQAQIAAIRENRDAILSMSEKLATYAKATADLEAKNDRLWARFEIDGVPMRPVDGTPWQVEVVS